MDADTGAPPPPGAQSPVPADAAARAAAAGRSRPHRAASAPERDALVPTTAIETRAQERARARRERVGLGAIGAAASGAVTNPAAGLPSVQLLPPGLAPAVAEAVPQRFAPVAWHPGPTPAAYGHPPQGYAPHGYAPQGYAPHGYAPQGSAPHGYAPHGYAPHGYAPQGSAPQGYAPMAHPPVVPIPPRVAWTRRQRSAALLGSWLGQTVMALATHLLTAFVLIVGFALLLHVSGDGSGDIEADSFTSVLARWTMPDRVWATALIGLLVGGGLLVAGWLLQALWARGAGLAKPHRSTWLAWLCTTAATAVVGLVVWPFALFAGLLIVLMDSSASLTTGAIWTTLFWELGIAIVLTGGVGLLFGWLFLAQARPRVDDPAVIAAAEEAARARDEAELAAVQLRGEPSEPAAGR